MRVVIALSGNALQRRNLEMAAILEGQAGIRVAEGVKGQRLAGSLARTSGLPYLFSSPYFFNFRHNDTRSIPSVWWPRASCSTRRM